MVDAIAVEVATGIITEAAKAVVTAVLTRASEQFRHLTNFNSHLTVLETKLKRLHLLLLSAESSTSINVNPLVEDWLNTVKSVAYDVDDLLDEFTYESVKRRVESRSRVVVIGSSRWVRFRIGQRMSRLIGAMDGVFDEAREIGIRPVELVGSSEGSRDGDMELQVRRELVTGRGLIGRDADEEFIVKMMCDGGNLDRDLSVFAIVGMAGLGKTALARRAFQRKEVGDYFKIKIWICVSHDFEVAALLTKMIELAGGKTSNLSSQEAMLLELEKNLRGNRFLLVLDDVWDTFLSVWESFSGALLSSGGSKGTVILATSRSSEVAGSMVVYDDERTKTTKSRPLIYELKGLGSDDSWLLFRQRVDCSIDAGSGLEAMARRMAIRCRGVPLAIKALGDLLRSMSIEEWGEIDRSDVWKLEDKNGILPSLKLSFNYLPSAAVKRCFAYCAIFPEDAIIRRQNLIELWMAQGYLQPYDKMEQVGKTYFNVLLNSSFFQDLELNVHGDVTCKMHDVVHALAKAVSRQECLIVRESSENMSNMSSDIRHLSLLAEKDVARELKQNLRTLMSESLHIHKPRDLLLSTKCLRVLSIADAGLTELPDSIGGLKHLRYLDISDNAIMTLPTAVSRLYNLQTLRYLCGSSWWWAEYPEYPKGLGKLVNLRHIYTDKFSLMGFSLKIRLQSSRHSVLSTFDQDRNWGTSISDLSSMDDLRGSLAIWDLEHVRSIKQARKASLRTKTHIHQLDLTWSYNATCFTNPDYVLEGLQPQTNLKVLSIWYYKGQTSPSWLIDQSLSNLVEMTICYCRNLKQLPTALVMPSLKVLVVWGCDNLASFPDVKALVCLEKLKMGRCPMLTDLPSLKPLINLKVLEIHSCGSMTNLPYGLPSLPNLTTLEVGPLCRGLDCFPFSTDINEQSPLSESLQELQLTGWPKVKNLPDQLQHFTRLRTLSIRYFDDLETIPDWLGNLVSLEVLELQHMVGLKYLPSRDALRHATKLYQLCSGKFDCPRLLNKMEFLENCHANLSRMQHDHYRSFGIE